LAPWARIRVLGSGGVLPTPERGTPAFLVYDWRGATILLDAGEGAQLRLWASERSVHDIDVIALTHEHGDHVNGLAGLLQSMAVGDRTRPLTIVGNKATIDFVLETLEATDTRLGFPVNTVVARGAGSITLYDQGGDRLTLQWLPSCHIPGSLAYRLVWSLRGRIDLKALHHRGLAPGPWIQELIAKGHATINGRVVTRDEVLRGGRTHTILYTGDTRPCQPIIEAARGARVLIHEATYTADMSSEAMARGHSASIHAGAAAREASVELLLLFHYSPRYSGAGVRRIIEEASQLFPNTLGAYDGLRLHIPLHA